jgi:hypothetical protein
VALGVVVEFITEGVRKNGDCDHEVVDESADSQKGLREQIRRQKKVDQGAGKEISGGLGKAAIKCQPRDQDEDVGHKEQGVGYCAALFSGATIDRQLDTISQAIIETEKTGVRFVEGPGLQCDFVKIAGVIGLLVSWLESAHIRPFLSRCGGWPIDPF